VPNPSPAPLPAPESLRRELTGLALTLLALNSMIGAGIFGLPAGAARLTGLFSPMIFVLCGVLMATLMVSFAQAASYFRGTGGHILYAQAAFGPFAGFQSGWLMYVGRMTAVAANSNLFATYLGTYIPQVNDGTGRMFVIVAIALLFAWLNIRGVKQGMGAILTISVAKFVPLILFVLIGLTYVRPAMFSGATVPSFGTVGEAALLVFYAFVGFEGSLVLAGESKDPQRDIPKALLATALLGTLLYVGIQTVSVALTPDLAGSTRPLADAASIFMGAGGVAMLSFAAMASILGNIGSSVLSAPRLTYVLARDGSLPTVLGAVHPRFLTPHVSILLFLVLCVGLGVAGSFTQLAIMSSLARLIAYTIGLLALPRLKAQFGSQPRAMQLPGGYAIPVAGFAICVWLMAQVQWEAVWKTAVFMGLGTVMYLAARRGKGGGTPLPGGE
jgi:amino acid transporter